MTSEVSGHAKGVVSTCGRREATAVERSERSERSPHHNYIQSVTSCVTHSYLFNAIQMSTRKRKEKDSNEKTCTHNWFECELNGATCAYNSYMFKRAFRSHAKTGFRKLVFR